MHFMWYIAYAFRMTYEIYISHCILQMHELGSTHVHTLMCYMYTLVDSCVAGRYIHVHTYIHMLQVHTTTFMCYTCTYIHSRVTCTYIHSCVPSTYWCMYIYTCLHILTNGLACVCVRVCVNFPLYMANAFILHFNYLFFTEGPRSSTRACGGKFARLQNATVDGGGHVCLIYMCVCM
jgi:hypothetical protein